MLQRLPHRVATAMVTALAFSWLTTAEAFAMPASGPSQLPRLHPTPLVMVEPSGVLDPKPSPGEQPPAQNVDLPARIPANANVTIFGIVMTLLDIVLVVLLLAVVAGVLIIVMTLKGAGVVR